MPRLFVKRRLANDATNSSFLPVFAISPRKTNQNSLDLLSDLDLELNVEPVSTPC